MNTAQKIIDKAREICKKFTMDYPDYDESLEMSLNDALTIIVGREVDVPSDELYDFFEGNKTQPAIDQWGEEELCRETDQWEEGQLCRNGKPIETCKCC